MPICSVCKESKANVEFTKNQAQKARGNKGGVCITCQNEGTSNSDTISQSSSWQLHSRDHAELPLTSMSACIAEVESLKAKENSLFKEGKFKEAVVCYERASHKLRPLARTTRGEASSKLPETVCGQVALLYATLHANTSQCHLSLKQFKLAQDEASKCLKHMPTHEKALLRHATASEQLGEWKVAIADLETLLVLNPHLGAVHGKTLDKLRKLCTKEEEKSKCSFVAGGMHQGRPHPAGWAVGLPKDKQYEWFVDCYRMRVDDDYCWGGGNLHGLYNIDGASAGSVAVDFLLFCKLAVARGAVPTPWSWSECLDIAAGLLMYAFEKSDAQDKWGNEHFFSTMMHGRSLRCTAELIYRESCQLGAFSDGPEDDLRSAIEVEIDMKLGYSPAPERFSSKVLNNVGGDKLWRRLCEKLVPQLGLGSDYEFDDDFDEEEEEGEEEEGDGTEEQELGSGAESHETSPDPNANLGARDSMVGRAGWSGPPCASKLAAEDVQHSCAHCGRKSAPGAHFQKCSRCLTVRYCSAECHKGNWKIHQKICRAPQLVA